MTSSSTPIGIDSRPRSAGWNVSTPEIETPAQHLPGDLSRQHPPNLDLRLGVPLAEAGDHRQQHMDRCLVCPDQDPPPSQVLELADRRLGFVPQLREALRVVEENLPGLGELSTLGGSIEQPLVQLVFQSPNRLADGGAASDAA